MAGYEQCQLHATNAVEQGRIAVIEEHASNDVSYPIDRAYKVWEFGTHEEYNDWLAETFDEDQIVTTDSWLDAPPEYMESAMSDDTSYKLHAPESMGQLTGPGGWPAPMPIPVSVLEATAYRLKQIRPDIEIEAVSTFEGSGNTHVAGEFYDSLTASSPVYPNHTVTITESTHLSFTNQQSQQTLQPKGHEVRVEAVNELTGEHTTPYSTFRWAEHREATLQDAQEQVRKLPQDSNPAMVEDTPEPEIYRQQLRDVAQRLNTNAGPELS